MSKNSDRWLLPEGVEELLPADARRVEAARRRVLDLFDSWGYDLVVPPFIEYLDSLTTGAGGDLELHTFTLIDQLSGRLLGIRADMTPQVARIHAQHFRSDDTARLCYLGTALHTLPDGISGSRSPIQLGAEFYGHRGLESDCEIVCLMLSTLRALRIEPVHLALGHVGVFRELARLAGCDPEQESELHRLMQRKANAEIHELIDGLGIEDDLARMLAVLTELNGGVEVLDRAAAALAPAGAPVVDALGALSSLAEMVGDRMPEVGVHVDLAELRGYRYHTGVVFAAFTPGQGREIARGGRYDDIGAEFGHGRPATGFSSELRTLVSVAGENPADGVRPSIVAPWSSSAELLEKVEALRQGGERVVFELPGGDDANPAGRRLRQVDGEWQVG